MRFLNSLCPIGRSLQATILGQCDALPQLFALRATSKYHQSCVNEFLRIFAFATIPERVECCIPAVPRKVYAFTNWIEASGQSSFPRLQSTYHLANRIQQIELPCHSNRSAEEKQQALLTLLKQQALTFRNFSNADLAIQIFQGAIQDLEISFTADKEHYILNHVACHYYQRCIRVYDDTPRQGKALLLQRLLDLQKRKLFFRIEETQNAIGQTCYQIILEERNAQTSILAAVNTKIPIQRPINKDRNDCTYQPNDFIKKMSPYDVLLKNCIKEGQLDSRNFLNELVYFRLATHEWDRHAAFSRLSYAILNNTKFLKHFLNLSLQDFEEFLTIYDSYLLELFSVLDLYQANIERVKNVPALLTADPDCPSRNILMTNIINKIVCCDPLNTLSEGLGCDSREHAIALISHFFKALDAETSCALFTKLFDVENSSLGGRYLIFERLFILKKFLQITKNSLLKADVEAVLKKNNFKNETIIDLLLKNGKPDSLEIIGMLFIYYDLDSTLVKNLLAKMTDVQRRAIHKLIAPQKQTSSCLLS